MALLKQIVVIYQIALVGENRKPRYRPGSDHQNPGPEDRCPMAWLGIVLHIGNFRNAHRTPPFPWYLSLGFEVGVALNGVAPTELPDHAILWNVHTVLRRPGKVGWRTRNRAEDSIMDGRGSAIGIRIGSHLRFNDFSHAQSPLPALDPVFNWHKVDRHPFTDQTRYVSQGTTQLATKDVEDGFLLRGRCP